MPSYSSPSPRVVPKQLDHVFFIYSILNLHASHDTNTHLTLFPVSSHGHHAVNSLSGWESLDNMTSLHPVEGRGIRDTTTYHSFVYFYIS